MEHEGPTDCLIKAVAGRWPLPGIENHQQCLQFQAADNFASRFAEELVTIMNGATVRVKLWLKQAPAETVIPVKQKRTFSPPFAVNVDVTCDNPAVLPNPLPVEIFAHPINNADHVAIYQPQGGMLPLGIRQIFVDGMDAPPVLTTFENNRQQARVYVPEGQAWTAGIWKQAVVDNNEADIMLHRLKFNRPSGMEPVWAMFMVTVAGGADVGAVILTIPTISLCQKAVPQRVPALKKLHMPADTFSRINAEAGRIVYDTSTAPTNGRGRRGHVGVSNDDLVPSPDRFGLDAFLQSTGSLDLLAGDVNPMAGLDVWDRPGPAAGNIRDQFTENWNTARPLTQIPHDTGQFLLQNGGRAVLGPAPMVGAVPQDGSDPLMQRVASPALAGAVSVPSPGPSASAEMPLGAAPLQGAAAAAGARRQGGSARAHLPGFQAALQVGAGELGAQGSWRAFGGAPPGILWDGGLGLPGGDGAGIRTQATTGESQGLHGQTERAELAEHTIPKSILEFCEFLLEDDAEWQLPPIPQCDTGSAFGSVAVHGIHGFRERSRAGVGRVETGTFDALDMLRDRDD